MSDMAERQVPVRYRIYIDESGDHVYRKLEKPEGRYLGLTGCFLVGDEYSTFQLDLERLKVDHFSDYPHRDRDEPLILHRNAIINRRGAFSLLRDPDRESAFNKALLDLFKKARYTIISVLIDKKAHVDRYKHPEHPYYYCLDAILERYCGYLNHIGATGDVMAESRAKTEDMQLKEEYRRIYHTGTRYLSSADAQRALTSREIKIKPKIANIAGLQLADLLAFPIKQQILLEEGRISDPGDIFGKEICTAVASKFNRQLYKHRVKGYGKIFLK